MDPEEFILRSKRLFALPFGFVLCLKLIKNTALRESNTPEVWKKHFMFLLIENEYYSDTKYKRDLLRVIVYPNVFYVTYLQR